MIGLARSHARRRGVTREGAGVSDKPRRRKDNRRARILNAAAAQFSVSGYSGTSVRDIATAADMLPGSMYYHFASKEELLAAVHEVAIARVKETVLAAITDQADPWERLEAACVAHVAAMLENKEYGSVVATELPSRHASALRDTMIAQRNDYEKIFRTLIDDLPLDPGCNRKYLRLALVGAMNWTLAWYRTDGDSPETIAREILRWFKPAQGDVAGATSFRQRAGAAAP